MQQRRIKGKGSSASRKKRQKQPSAFSLLQELAENCNDTFDLVLQKLTDEEVRKISGLCRAIRHQCRERVLHCFVHRTLEHYSIEHTQKRLQPPLQCTLGDAMTRFGDPIRSRNEAKRTLLWEHFPSEFQWIDTWKSRTGKQFYWMSPEWQRRRREFLETTPSQTLEQAALVCGQLKREYRPKLLNSAHSPSSPCLSFHYWAPIEALDFSSSTGCCGVFVHPESTLFAYAFQSASPKILKSFALFYHFPEYTQAFRNYPHAFWNSDALIPEPLAKYIIWLPESTVECWFVR